MGHLIVIEGTDCSGKETQTNLLIKKLSKNLKIIKTSFPMYDSPTGKIVGGSYLGKQYIGEGLFLEGSANVDQQVSALYYAADRKYNIPKINKMLKENDIVLLDRYVESNMAHQGGKLKTKEEREKMYTWLETLEYDLLELPKPDLTILLYLPYKYACSLKKYRTELPDQNEISEEHLINAENAYLELANRNNFKVVNCVQNDLIKDIEVINEEIIHIINEYLEK